MPDNNIHYSLSRADTPKDTRGTPASDLRIDPTAAKPVADPCPNPQNVHVPSSVLREMLRCAEAEHACNHKRRCRKLFWVLFRTIFLILSLLMFFYCVGTLSPQTFLEYLLIAVESAICSAIFSLIIAAIGYPIHMGAHESCFAGELDELLEIEKLKDSMCQSNQKGQA